MESGSITIYILLIIFALILFLLVSHYINYTKINNNILDSRIDEFKQYVKEQLSESNDSFVSENGEVEKWIGKLDKDKVDEFTLGVIEHLESLKH